jgi:hypothetical protein
MNLAFKSIKASPSSRGPNIVSTMAPGKYLRSICTRPWRCLCDAALRLLFVGSVCVTNLRELEGDDVTDALRNVQIM